MRAICRRRISADKFDLAVCDVELHLGDAADSRDRRRCSLRTAAMMILVKPQFEVGRGQVGKGGIVRDPELHRAACDRVARRGRSARVSRRRSSKVRSWAPKAIGSSCCMPMLKY